MPAADRFGPHWPEIAGAGPGGHVSWLVTHGFRVYRYRAPRRPGPGEAVPAGLEAVRITWDDPDGARKWTEGHGRTADDAATMAYGAVVIWREQQAVA